MLGQRRRRFAGVAYGTAGSRRAFLRRNFVFYTIQRTTAPQWLYGGIASK